MKRKSIILISILIILSLLVGCTGGKDTGKSKKTSNPEQSKVFKPDELLSQDEAAKIVGKVVTLDTGSLEVDKENGESTTYYAYDIDGGTTLNAGLVLKQNGAVSKEQLKEGNDAKSQYDYYYDVCKDDMEPIKNLGDKAFAQKSTAQVFVLYGDYFILSMFSTTSYGDYENSRDLNIKIIKKVIENINKKK